MLYRAAVVLAGDGIPVADGAVRVEGERIAAVGPAAELPPLPGEEVRDLGPQVLSPGFINAHCHLDYSRMRGLLPGQRFVRWIESINALKRSFSDDDYLEAIAYGFTLLQQGGTTTVANIESFPELLPRLGPPPIRAWWFLELTDLRQRVPQDEYYFGMLSFFQERTDWLGGFGLSPHSPYTASLDLYHLAKRCSEEYGMPFTTHIAESLEEQEMFLYGQGPLYEMMHKLGRDTSDCGQGSPSPTWSRTASSPRAAWPSTSTTSRNTTGRCSSPAGPASSTARSPTPTSATPPSSWSGCRGKGSTSAWPPTAWPATPAWTSARRRAPRSPRTRA